MKTISVTFVDLLQVLEIILNVHIMPQKFDLLEFKHYAVFQASLNKPRHTKRGLNLFVLNDESNQSVNDSVNTVYL